MRLNAVTFKRAAHERAEWEPPGDQPEPITPEEIPSAEPEQPQPGPQELPGEPEEVPPQAPPESRDVASPRANMVSSQRSATTSWRRM